MCTRRKPRALTALLSPPCSHGRRSRPRRGLPTAFASRPRRRRGGLSSLPEHRRGCSSVSLPPPPGLGCCSRSCCTSGSSHQWASRARCGGARTCKQLAIRWRGAVPLSRAVGGRTTSSRPPLGCRSATPSILHSHQRTVRAAQVHERWPDAVVAPPPPAPRTGAVLLSGHLHTEPGHEGRPGSGGLHMCCHRHHCYRRHHWAFRSQRASAQARPLAAGIWPASSSTGKPPSAMGSKGGRRVLAPSPTRMLYTSHPPAPEEQHAAQVHTHSAVPCTAGRSPHFPPRTAIPSRTAGKASPCHALTASLALRLHCSGASEAHGRLVHLSVVHLDGDQPSCTQESRRGSQVFQAAQGGGVRGS